MKNKILLTVIKFLARFLDKGDLKVHYARQSYGNNTIDKVYYPLSYFLKHHTEKFQHGILVQDGLFTVHVDRDR